MALTDAQVLDALRGVRDPDLEKSVVDLGMVKEVKVKRGKVTVRLGQLHPETPRDELARRVTAGLAGLDGVERVEVDVVPMNEADLAAVEAFMRRSQPGGGVPTTGESGPKLGHEEGRANPFGPGSKTRVLGVSSGKGGVGKSSVTVNLAITLRRLGYDVAIVDADVYGFSIPKMLGVERDPIVIGEMIVPPVGHGVKVISVGFFVSDEQPVMWRGPMLHKALEQFLVDVYWGEPDFLLIDMPPGTGDVALSMSQYLPASEVYVVTTPQAAAQRVAQRTAYMAKKINLPLRGVVENMSWFTGDDGKRYLLFGEGGGQQLADALGVPLLGQVPLVPDLREGGDIGLPVTVSDPDGEAARAFAGIAERVVEAGPSRIFRSELQIR